MSLLNNILLNTNVRVPCVILTYLENGKLQIVFIPW